jgi:DNA-binding MarR family transcriptional regulator
LSKKPPAGKPRFVEGYLGYLLGQANHAVYKDFDAQVRAAGLSSIEWRVLATLHDSPPLTVSDLAKHILSKQPTVTKLVQRMVASGWLVLENDSADQRRTMVRATRAGVACARPLVLRARKHEAALLDVLGEADTAALKSALEKLSAL